MIKEPAASSLGKHCMHIILLNVINQPYIKLVGKLKDKNSKTVYIHNKQLRDTEND